MNISPINFQANITNSKQVNFGHKVVTPEILDDFVKNRISYSEFYFKGYRYITRDAISKVVQHYINALKVCLEKHPDNALLREHIEQMESYLRKIHTKPFIRELSSPETLESCRK